MHARTTAGPVTLKLQGQLGQHDVGQLSVEHVDGNSACAISIAPGQLGFSYNQVCVTLRFVIPRYCCILCA
jgi:hypothetical protein